VLIPSTSLPKCFAVAFALLFAASSQAAGGATFKPASKAKEGPKTCTAPAFLDLRLDDLSVGPRCYSCPDGYNRTANPVTSNEACSKAGGDKFDKADFKNHFSCDTDADEFYDPRKGGECWKCPKSKPRRTLYAVTSDKACATPEIVGEKLGKASFEHKNKECTGGAFHDPRNGGECWKCPKGYVRTAEPVDSKKACSKTTSESLKKADEKGHFGCAKGTFLDVGTGQCWSCPSGFPYRTVNPVDGPRACADQLVGVFAADNRAICGRIVAALKKGKDGVEDLQQIVESYIDPVKKPLQEKLDVATDYVADQTKLDEKVGAMVAQAKKQDTIKAVTDFGTNVGNTKEQLEKIILDENLVCNGTPQQVDDALKKLKLLQQEVSTIFIAVSASATFTHPTDHVAVTVGLTWATNLSGDGGLFVSVGMGATSSSDPTSVDIGAMLLPGTTLNDFVLTAVPGITVSVSKGKKFDALVQKVPEVGPMCMLVDALDVAWGFDTKKLPTFGVGKNIVSVEGKTAHFVDVSAMVGWDFPVLTYKGWKIQ
jgi:hypothetical protein